MAMNERQTAAHKLGVVGEEAAARWYCKAGFKIIARNWRCFEGEIDIIARRGRTTVVCEVKTRASGRFMDPALAVSRSKQNKIRIAAYRWLDENQSLGQLRFDVALVVNGRVQILEAAF